MIYVESGVYVRVSELENGPMPRPLQSGFSEGTQYRVLGMESFSETGEAYCMLSNDRDEMWFISNRHFRVVGVFKERDDLRVPKPAERASFANTVLHSIV